uniref:Uncharacterized protein n=1 Tax=Anguilla anguilla TaxID=7936 RepID=A0A0E9RIN9_ANGAN
MLQQPVNALHLKILRVAS